MYPLWISGDGLRNVPELKGPALGVTSGIEYEKKEITLSLGESMLFLTDGITEAENDQAELFGHHRLTDNIQQINGPPWGEALLGLVNSWQGTAKASDDLTMFEIWRDPT